MNQEHKDAVKMAIYDWEDKNLCNYNGYVLQDHDGHDIEDNMQTRGYDGMRISARPTIKHGLKYLKVWGASFEPNYTRGLDVDGKHYVNVTWYHQGYIKYDVDVKKGVTVFDVMIETFNQEHLKMVLGV